MDEQTLRRFLEAREAVGRTLGEQMVTGLAEVQRQAGQAGQLMAEWLVEVTDAEEQLRTGGAR